MGVESVYIYLYVSVIIIIVADIITGKKSFAEGWTEFVSGSLMVVMGG